MNTDMLQALKTLKPDFEKYGLKSLRLFGSMARDDYTPQSDVNLLVEFETPPSLLELASLTRCMQQHLGRRVDLVFAHKIFPELREEILQEAIDV